MDENAAARFRSKIVAGPEAHDCWIWTGAIGDDGYGRFWTPVPEGGQRMIRAHRYALALLTGSLDELDEFHVCHTCDNPICVRAEDGPSSHLYAGTAAQNMADRSRRGHHNKQPAAAFFRYETKQERAATARVLRDHVRAHGYDPEAVATLLRGVVAGQQSLF